MQSRVRLRWGSSYMRECYTGIQQTANTATKMVKFGFPNPLLTPPGSSLPRPRLSSLSVHVRIIALGGWCLSGCTTDPINCFLSYFAIVATPALTPLRYVVVSSPEAQSFSHPIHSPSKADSLISPCLTRDFISSNHGCASSCLPISVRQSTTSLSSWRR